MINVDLQQQTLDCT